jgi:hypothetical protein
LPGRTTSAWIIAIRPFVLILAVHAPIGSLIGPFVLVAVPGDRRDKSPAPDRG